MKKPFGTSPISSFLSDWMSPFQERNLLKYKTGSSDRLPRVPGGQTASKPGQQDPASGWGPERKSFFCSSFAA
jgi:hypothetical protein